MVEKLILGKYMINLIGKRNQLIKESAEGGVR